MFRRQNSGKPLNGKSPRIVNESDDFSDSVYSLATHPLIDQLMTKAQRKNNTDRDLIIQTFMLIESNIDQEFVSFRSRDVDVSIPMILFCGYYVKKNKKSFSKLVDIINEFLVGYNNNE